MKGSCVPQPRAVSISCLQESIRSSHTRPVVNMPPKKSRGKAAVAPEKKRSAPAAKSRQRPVAGGSRKAATEKSGRGNGENARKRAGNARQRGPDDGVAAAAPAMDLADEAVEEVGLDAKGEMLKSVASKVGISVEELKAIIDKAEREGSDSEDSDVLYAGEQGNAGSWETWRDEPDIPPPDSEDEGDETDEFVATILDVLENPVADPTEAAATAVAAAEAGPNPMKTMGNRRDAVHAAIKAVGWLLVKGIPEGDDESDSEEDEDVSDAKLTQAQVDTLRYIAVTPGREKAIRSMEKLILREQFNSPVHMFNTHYSYTILQSFGQFVDFCKGRPWPEKADYLMAYTKMLGAYDVWMHDHEICWADSGGREFIRDLAKMWRDMLKQSDQTLKIDTAFTRPGMVALAEQFKKDVEGIEVAGQKLVFKLK